MVTATGYPVPCFTPVVRDWPLAQGMELSNSGTSQRLSASTHSLITSNLVCTSPMPLKLSIICLLNLFFLLVWSCSWHWDGVALASGSMDHTAKLWDTKKYGNPKSSRVEQLIIYFSTSPCFSGVCIVTLRGHADSVNSVQFLPYSNMLATCSADKTVSLWDARTVRNCMKFIRPNCENQAILGQ